MDGLRIQRLSKTFPGTRALSGAHLTARHGRVLALLGHNGSGKSTLIKILAGFHRPDPGSQAWVDGQPLQLGSSHDAKRHGLRFVHQDLGLVDELNAVDNVGLTIGYARSSLGRVAQRDQVRRTTELLGPLGIELDVLAPLRDASAVTRTCVAIARAMWDWKLGPRVLVLDEPTASLPSREVSRLFSVLREIRSGGHTVIYVSHRLDEIFDIADDVLVLRNGRVVGSGLVAEHSRQELASLIAGGDLPVGTANENTAANVRADKPVLSVRGLSGRSLRGVNFNLYRGEILGVAGLVGSGRDELPYVLAGAKAASAGTLYLDDTTVAAPRTIDDALRLGIALLPAERDREGIVANFTVAENLTLGVLPSFRGRGHAFRPRLERNAARQWLREMDIPEERADHVITTLSGGNKQRVLLARLLYTNPSILLMAEPTAGVDVRARSVLYSLLRAKADAGLSVVLSSSDVEDIVTICDRVILMRAGRIVDELAKECITATAIIQITETG